MSLKDKQKPRGRPKGYLKPNALRATIMIRASEEQLAKWNSAAAKVGERISEWIRKTLDECS